MYKSLCRLSVCALLLAACRTTYPEKFVPSESMSAKLSCSTPSETFRLNAVIQRSGTGVLRLILSREKGTPFLVITRTPSNLEVRDLVKNRHWQGSPTRPPIALIGWSALIDALATAPHMPEGSNEVHSAYGWIAVYHVENGKLKSLDVLSSISSERYQLTLDPFYSPLGGR